MIYTPDLARNAVQAALDVPASALNQSVDVCWDVPATGPQLAAAFTRALGRPVVAKPAIPPFVFAVLPLLARFVPALRDSLAVLAWIRKGGYVSRDAQKQKDLFGEPPTIEDAGGPVLPGQGSGQTDRVLTVTIETAGGTSGARISGGGLLAGVLGRVCGERDVPDRQPLAGAAALHRRHARAGRAGAALPVVAAR